MTFGLPPVRLVADFRASAMGIKPKSPGSVATVSNFSTSNLKPIYFNGVATKRRIG
jgi:glucokinase